jgi:hypothetical protein
MALGFWKVIDESDEEEEVGIILNTTDKKSCVKHM